MSPRAGLSTDKIVAAAAELADEQGIEGVTLAALAAKLGVRPPSLYNHIDGQSGLRTLVAVQGINRLYERMNEALSASGEQDAVFAVAGSYVRFAREHPGLYEMTLKAPDSAHKGLVEAGDRLLELIVGTLKPYQLGAAGELHAVRGLRSILHGFASLEQKGGFGMKLDIGKSLMATLEAFLSGIERFKSL